MKLSEITLGSKQHADAIAAHRAQQKLTWGKFSTIVKNSTMSERDVSEILDAIELASNGSSAFLSRELRRSELEQLSAIADVSLGELLALAGF